MDDKPGSFRVSRHTMVMRMVKDDHARRLVERDDGVVVHDDPTNVSARLTAKGAGAPSGRESRTASGRQVVVESGGRVSGRYSARLSGRHAESVRVAGGDTIIRYKSGDMVIKRGARRVEFRRQLIWVYAAGYLLLFGSFMYWLLTGVTTMTPEAFVENAFSRRQSADIVDLERAALEVMRGNRTPAEIRLAQSLSFYDEDKDTVKAEKGDRLTLLTAAKLGHAIIEDRKRPADKRAFQEPFRIYKETYLSRIDWPHVMTLYNAVGFFLLAGLFLWRPIVHYLGTQGKKTAVALRNARDAKHEAEEYREKYRELDRDIESRSKEMAAGVGTWLETEKNGALEQARRQADVIVGGIDGAIRNERMRLFGDIGTEAARAACDGARDILRERLGPKEHAAAIDDLIADIAALAGGAKG